uniref:Methyltransferase domain-containing protein n=1 Tax=Zonotrichia albicollis TaxID=44394 RepID=A0A8D2MX63_ZONAL
MEPLYSGAVHPARLQGELRAAPGPEGAPGELDWDAAYERELQTFQDIGDTGEIWFGEESMVRIIRWLEKHKVPLDSSVLDIGTGNGVLLVELAKSGYMNLTGIDYSPSAIQLSEKVRDKEGMSNIKLKVEDFLAPSAELSGFDICIDKGTFDAVSLDPSDAAGKRRLYVASLGRVLKPEGFFLITSSNNILSYSLCQNYFSSSLAVKSVSPKSQMNGQMRG